MFGLLVCCSISNTVNVIIFRRRIFGKTVIYTTRITFETAMLIPITVNKGFNSTLSKFLQSMQNCLKCKNYSHAKFHVNNNNTKLTHNTESDAVCHQRPLQGTCTSMKYNYTSLLYKI